jgi:PPOX class probable F420-dependent enzyme
MTLANEKYLSLVTFRKNGEPVATAVWVAGMGDELGVITEESAGKVKRIRNNPRVTLTPCDVKGKVLPGAATTEATARLVTGEDAVRVDRAIRRKYHLAYFAISLTWVIPALWDRMRGRGETSRDFAILIMLD